MNPRKLTLLLLIAATSAANSRQKNQKTISSITRARHFALGTAKVVGLTAEAFSLLGISHYMFEEFGYYYPRLSHILACAIAATTLVQSGYGLSRSTWNSFKQAWRPTEVADSSSMEQLNMRAKE